MGANLPDSQQIIHACELGRSSLRVMTYLSERLRVTLHKSRAQADYEVDIKAVDETFKITERRDGLMQSTSSKCWINPKLVTDTDLNIFKADTLNYLDVSAMNDLEALNLVRDADHQLSDIVMAYYIDENAQFHRGYVVDDQVIDDTTEEHKKIVEALDKMFHSWLVTNKMESDDDGFIYVQNGKGKLEQTVNSAEVLELMQDPDNGFQRTVEKIDPNIKWSMILMPPETVKQETTTPDEKAEKKKTQNPDTGPDTKSQRGG